MHPGFFGWWKGRGPRGGQNANDGCGDDARESCGPRDGGPGCGPGDHHGFGPFGPFGPGGPGGRHGGPPRGPWGHHHEHHHHGHDDDAGFGVRRPLRFLAWKLELEEAQFGKLASILDTLKIERAQAAVDQRRSIAGLADAVGGATFDEAKAKEAGEVRVKSAERLRDAVLKALGDLHALLDDEQRQKLAYLLRTGALSI